VSRAGLAALLLAAALPAHAADPAAILNDRGALDAAAQDARARLQEALQAGDEALRSGKPLRSLPKVEVLPGPKTGIDPARIAQRYLAQPAAKAAQPALYVLVSLSVPEASLKRIAREAATAGAVLILRGLKGDPRAHGLLATVQALRPLADTGAAVQVHPQLFSRFAIEAVPAYVLTTDAAEHCQDDARACTPYYAVAGDVPLRYALEHLAQQGAGARELARPFLAKLAPQP
jgi:conjugal transfer pilus assembly protein TrbC